MLIVAYLITRLPTCILNNISLFEFFFLLFIASTIVSNLPYQVFGYSAFVH